MKTITISNTDYMRAVGKCGGWMFNFPVANNTANTDMSAQIIDFTKVLITCTLKRNGKTKVIYDGNLGAIHLHTNWNNRAWAFGFGFEYIQTVVKAATQKAAGVIPIRFMHECIDVQPGDSYELKVNYQSSSNSSQVYAATNIVEVSQLDTFEHEHATPFFDIVTIPTNEGSYGDGLHVGVHKVSFVNLDPNTTAATQINSANLGNGIQILDAGGNNHQVVTQVSCNADGVSRDYDYNMLLSERFAELVGNGDDPALSTGIAAVNLRAQCFRLLDAKEPKKTGSFTITLNSAQVNSSYSFVIQEGILMFAGHQQKSAKVQAANNIKIAAAIPVL